MSSGVARNAFRSELAAAFPSLLIVETLAVRVDNVSLPALWAATDFMPISDDAISIGRPTCCRELGTFRCYAVCKAGDGEGPAIALADSIAAHFRNWRNASQQLRVTGVIPPAPSEFSDGRWLICAVDFAFARDHFV